MFQTVEHARLGTIDVPGMPYRFSETNGAIKLAAPELGEHNQMLLSDWLGYSDAEIEQLRANKIIT